MTQPTPYRRGYDFSDAGGAQPPGGPLDNELDALARTTRDILRNMALLQRDDTALRNGIVGIDALDSRVLGLISGGTFSIAGAWATATSYPAGAFLTDDGAIYLVMEAHTSTSIVDDLAAGRIAKALQNEQGSRLRDDFTGNAVQTAFSLSQSPARPSDVEVYADGSLVPPGDYVQTGATVTFDVAPANGVAISIFSITWATAPPIQTLVDAVGDRNLEISAASQFLGEVGIGGAALISELTARPTTAALASSSGAGMVWWQSPAANAQPRASSAKLAEQLVTPEDFRQAGDTSLSRLQRFLDALGNGRYGRLDADYVIPSQLTLTDRERFKLYGNGYKISLAVGAATGYGGSAIYIARCNSFEISDLIFDGNRANRVPAEDPAHVVVIDKCNDWRFKQVQANNGTSDGFYINAGSGGSGPGGIVLLADVPQRWVLEDCTALNNYRQGCSVIEGMWGTFLRGRYGLTSGLWEVAGGPCAGIDLESDNQPTWDQNRIQHIDFIEVLLDQNQGPGLLLTNINGTRHIRVIDCKFDRNKKAAIESVADQVEIVRPIVTGWDQVDYTANAGAPNKRGCIDIGFGAGHHRITSPSFADVSNGASDANPCIYVHGGAARGITVTDIVSDGSASIILSASSPTFKVSGGTLDLSGATSGFAMTINGDDSEVSGIFFARGYNGLVYMGGARPTMRDLTATMRTTIGPEYTQYIFNTIDASYPTIKNCRIHCEGPMARYGFGIGVSARIEDTWVTNMTTTDSHVFGGAAILRRANYRLDNPFTETAITP